MGGTPLHVTGYVLVLLYTIASEGTHRTAQEVIYIVCGISAVFLSLPACMALGIVPAFSPAPRPGPVAATTLTHRPHTSRRTLPPPRPAAMPLPPTNDNLDNLTQLFHCQFAGSVFNVLSRPLPTMSGPPMKIHLYPDTPILHHWKEQMKVDLKRSVAMGILEPVEHMEYGSIVEGDCKPGK